MKFLMLIWKPTFVFHKSKQATTKATLKKLSKKIARTEVSFCYNERKNVRNLRPEKLEHRVTTQASKVRFPLRIPIPFFGPTHFPFKSILVFACSLFGKTNTIFSTIIMHTINHAKQN